MVRHSPTILLVDPVRARRQALGRLFAAAGLNAVQAGSAKGCISQAKRRRPALIIARVQSTARRELAWRGELLESPATAHARVWVMAPLKGVSAIRTMLGPADHVSGVPDAPEQIVAQARAFLSGDTESVQPAASRERLLQMEVHDLKTPLANIINLCDLLLSGDLEAERRDEFITSVVDNAKIMLKLVMNLLNVAALESGQMTLNRQQVPPAEAVQAAITQAGWLLRRKRMRIRPSIARDLPTLTGDRELLVRLFVNLVDNAVQHGQANDELELAAGRDDGGVRFDVLDRGSGIPEALRDRIFDPYVQLEPGSRHSFTTGLGLTFCRLVVGAHGGRIWVEPREGGGSRFSVWLPA
jgi:signal transduction histidine kinase